MYNEFFSRNLGILSDEDQEKLRTSSIAIAGVGGIGGFLAERLTRIGLGKIKITDPGLFEPSNSNRQYGANSQTLNKYKAEVVAGELQKINPDAIILFDIKGINTQKDAAEFANGTSIVIDEMDYGLFKQNIYLQRAARKQGSYYIFSTAIGFGSLVALFRPDGITLEEFNGFPKDIEKGEQLKLTKENILPHFPSYLKGKENLVDQMIERTIPVSSNSVGVGLASIITANEVVNIILKKNKIITAPKSIYIDLMDKKIII